MHGFMLCDWLTLRGTSAITSIAQSEAAYLDLAAFHDFVAWVEVGDFSAAGAANPRIFLETAPLKDEALFAPTNGWNQTAVTLATGTSTAKNILNAGVASQLPLARWLRWRVDMTGASSTWSVTFRVHVAAHSVVLPDR